MSRAETHDEQSRNWAGYVVDSRTGHGYSVVSGRWQVPSVSTSPRYASSANWVGIGGSKQGSDALEQTGTSSDVVNGKARYSAWYEIVPAAETNFELAVHPGDQMDAKVTISGGAVTMSLSDETTGQSATKTEHPNRIDTSSAEWIAEAPSIQTPGGGDQVLPLADFGTTAFTNASATAGRHVGPIGDSHWTVNEIALDSGAQLRLPGASGGFGGPPSATVTLPSTGNATPSELSHDGSSFSVSYGSAGGTDASSSSRSAGGAPGGCVHVSVGSGSGPTVCPPPGGGN